MRGEGLPCLACLRGHGITPAHAGRSCHKRLVLHDIGDHPRACGEKSGLRLRGLCGLGSPPRMRGEDGLHHPKTYATGITPAHAGRST